MSYYERFVLVFFLVLSFATIGYSAEREHEAHEHGVAELNIVLDESMVVIQFLSPAVNLVGFEHAPGDDEQKTLVENAVATLKKGDSLFDFPSAAGCHLEDAEVHSSIDDDHVMHGDEHHDEDHDEKYEEEHHEDEDEEHAEIHSDEHKEETHSEFEAGYKFVCKEVATINQISTTLLEAFPLTEEIAVQLITSDAQTKATLTAGEATIQF